MIVRSLFCHIRNILGQIIRQYNISGKTSQQWDGCNSSGIIVKSGIYLYCIKYDNYISIAQKMIFIY